MSSIVIYYSRTGNTKLVADTIAEKTGAETIEIKDKTSRSGGFGYIKGAVDALRNKETEIEPELVDLKDYEEVYVGSPVWASKPTPAIIELINNTDFTDKNVITYVTLKSSGGDKTIDKMNDAIKNKGGNIKNSFMIIDNGTENIKNSTIEALNDN